LTAAKLRPGLVVYEGERDVIAAFISSKVPSEASEVNVLVTRRRAGFGKTGLKVDSVINLNKLVTVLKDLVVDLPAHQNPPVWRTGQQGRPADPRKDKTSVKK
jgi:mRNA interferase MazF